MVLNAFKANNVSSFRLLGRRCGTGLAQRQSGNNDVINVCF